MASWHLQDPSDLRESAKYTFAFPSAKAIAKLRVGHLVKLGFQFEPAVEGYSAERMWVSVHSRNEDGQFTGTLQDTPHFIKDLKPGAMVTFEEKHVIGDDLPADDDDDDIVSRYYPRCLVTRRVLYDGAKVTCLHREVPDPRGQGPIAGDSGWRLLAGDETPEYMSNPENVFYVSLGAVLNRDDRFVHLLDSPIGSEFEFDESTGAFGPPLEAD